jgi:hypothetical protein
VTPPRPVGTIASGVTALVDERGTVRPVDARWSLGWWIGADDRWHRAEREVAVRQQLVDDTPVVETAMRVPGGDIVQRVYGIRSGGDDAIVVSFENQTAVPVALTVVLDGVRKLHVDGATVHLDRRPALWFEKAPVRFAAAKDVEAVAAVVTAGDAGDAPLTLRRGAAAFVLPLAHRTTTSVVLTSAEPQSVPSLDQVVRGWKVQSDRGIRVVVPDTVLESTIDAGRRFALLAQDDALVLARYGYRDEAVAVAERQAPEIAAAADRLARSRTPDPVALRDAAEALTLAGEEQAAGIALRAASAADAAASPGVPRAELLDIRDRLLRETDDGVAVCNVVPDEWLGQGIEVHDAPTRFGPVSYAVRWHGDRPALLWDGPEGIRITAPGLDATWSSGKPKGDALLSPVAPPGTPVRLRRG